MYNTQFAKLNVQVIGASLVMVNKKGEGRFSFTFLRREISPATLWATCVAFI
jgi:hypothetical protein